MRLLVVEDNQSLVANLFEYFEARGHALDAAPDGVTGLHLATTQSYDAMILDWMLPRMDGREVLRRLREQHDCGVPVIMLTARDELPDKISGFRAGADDYLTKPFDLGELVARLHALLRRAHHSDPTSDTMTVGSLTIDTARRLVFSAGERVELTKREFDLLATLAKNVGVVLSRQRLLELVWGYDFDVDTNVADVFVSYLRRKLERGGLPRMIHTVRGIGYVLREEP